jgi:acyl carrier protein
MIEDRLLEILNELIEESGRQTVDKYRGEIRLRDDLGFDSLDLAILGVRVEAVFGVDVFKEGVVSTLEELAQRLNC